ncbi:MAG: hypothetical protein LBF04_03865 [Prevotellaceae bacterium]|jgi:hypothetical protein|nr:hypothetical protein [Prevotellaceae bacterium]
MTTKIVFKDDQHIDKKAVITIEEGLGRRLEFFPACRDDDKEERSYAQLANLFFDYILKNKI